MVSHAELRSAPSLLWQFVFVLWQVSHFVVPCKSGYDVVRYVAQAVVSVMLNLSVMFFVGYSFCPVMIALSCHALSLCTH